MRKRGGRMTSPAGGARAASHAGRPNTERRGAKNRSHSNHNKTTAQNKKRSKKPQSVDFNKIHYFSRHSQSPREKRGAQSSSRAGRRKRSAENEQEEARRRGGSRNRRATTITDERQKSENNQHKIQSFRNRTRDKWKSESATDENKNKIALFPAFYFISF